MRIERGRPVIEAGDHPSVIEQALRESIPYTNATGDEEEAAAWVKTACDSYESLQDAFWLGVPEEDRELPAGSETMLYMSVGRLEEVICIYGLAAARTAQEVAAADMVLRRIDEAKTSA